MGKCWGGGETIGGIGGGWGGVDLYSTLGLPEESKRFLEHALSSKDGLRDTLALRSKIKQTLALNLYVLVKNTYKFNA